MAKNKKYIRIIIFSSHKAGDYDSCNGLDDDDCLICNGDKNRTMITGNKCMCDIGYFDPGYE